MKRISYLLLIVLLYGCKQKSCKVKVLLTTGETIRCQYVQSFVSGVSNIKMCDDTDLIINSNDIKQIN